VSFYLLTLPFLRAATNWALGLDFMAVLLIGALYSWRGDSFDFRPAPRALAHISVLIAAFAVTLAVSAWLGRYDLLFAHNSTVVWGAAYTDVNARLPLYTFQAGAGIVLAGAVLANAWLRRLWIPVAAAGVWIVLSIVSQAYPAVVQGVSATPNAGTYELPYIAREIDYTRRAYGLSDVTGNTGFTRPDAYALPPPCTDAGEVSPPKGDHAPAPPTTHESDYAKGSQNVSRSHTGTHGAPKNSINRALWSLKLNRNSTRLNSSHLG